MTDLTDDERTVLMIAAEDKSMMAIGRWEKSIDSLVQKGLMERGDKWNNWITPAGREAIKEAEDEPYRKILEVGINLRNQQEQARASVEQAATHLMFAAKASALATGDSPQAAAASWSPKVLERALELLRQT